MARALNAAIGDTLRALEGRDGDLGAIRNALAAGAQSLQEAVDFIVASARSDVRAVFAGSVPYLKLAGVVLGGWQLARAALAARTLLDAGNPDTGFLAAKIGTARFFADHILSQAPALRHAIVSGAAGALALEDAQF